MRVVTVQQTAKHARCQNHYEVSFLSVQMICQKPEFQTAGHGALESEISKEHLKLVNLECCGWERRAYRLRSNEHVRDDVKLALFYT